MVLRPTIFLKKRYPFTLCIDFQYFSTIRFSRVSAFTIVPLEHYVFVCPLNSFLLHDRSNDVCSLLSMIESCWDFALCTRWSGDTIEWSWGVQWLLCKQCSSSLCRCTRFMQKNCFYSFSSLQTMPPSITVQSLLLLSICIIILLGTCASFWNLTCQAIQ